MSRLRGSSRSHTSFSSLSPLADTPPTPATPQSHKYRQLTLVPQMRSMKQRSPRDASKAAPARSSSLSAATLDVDSNETSGSASQLRKQRTLDSFLVPQLTAEQRRQQRRERRQERNAVSAKQRTATTVSVYGGEEAVEDVRQNRLRTEAEARERHRVLKDERMYSEDEEDIPLFRIAPPALPTFYPAPTTPSSSTQSQSSLPSSLSSSAMPSSASPARLLKNEDDDEWDDIPVFVLQQPQSKPPLPPPPPQPSILPAPCDPLSLVQQAAPHRPQPPPLSPPPLHADTAARVPPAASNPFAQSKLLDLSVSMKAEYDDAPRVRLPLSQILQSLSDAKSAAGTTQRPPSAFTRVKDELMQSTSDKENRSPTITTPLITAQPTRPLQAQRSPLPSLSSPPPLESATQRDCPAIERHSSAAFEHSMDSISSVEEEGATSQQSRVKRERVAPVDDIEDELEARPYKRERRAIRRTALFPSREHISRSSSIAPSRPSATQNASPLFALPPPSRHLHQPQPVHPLDGTSPLLRSPPPAASSLPYPLPLPSSHNASYAGPVESWPLAFPQAEDEVKQAGSRYSFRGISELQGQAAVNYGQLFQPKTKRKRATSKQAEEGGRQAKTEKTKAKRKNPTAKKRRKSEGKVESADEGADDEEAEDRGRKSSDKQRGQQKKKRASGRWTTVNHVRTYIVGGRRLVGSAAYMAYQQASGGGSKKKTATSKATKRKASGRGKKAKKERRNQPDGDDSGEEEWQPGDGTEGKVSGSGADSGSGSGDESAGSLADFIVDDHFIEPASSENE